MADADFVEPNADGSFNVQPPEGTTLDADNGVLEFPPEEVAEHCPMPDDVVINADGSLTTPVPPDTLYDPIHNTLTFAEGEVHLNEMPEGINAFENPDGTVSAYLPDGIEFDPENGSVTMDNYWANEFAPQEANITPEGGVEVNLPDDTQYNDDGSFTVTESSADFLEEPPPEYVTQGPDWVDSNPDGSFTAEPPPEVNINPDENLATMPADFVNEQFDEYMPEDFTLNADGSSTTVLPEGTEYLEGANALIFPEAKCIWMKFLKV